MRIFSLLIAIAAINVLLWAGLLFKVPPSAIAWTSRDALMALGGIILSASALIILTSEFVRQRRAMSGTGDGEPVRRSTAGWITALAIVIAGGLLLAGILRGEVRPVGGALLLLLGGGALFTIIAAAERLAEGSEVEVSSHWGGLGGSLAGWRISQTAILLLLALILVSAVVMAGNGLTPVEANQSVQTNSSGTSGADSKQGAREANEAGSDSNVASNEQGNVAVNDTAANVSGGVG